jgi:hypothetical protein
MKVLVVGSGGVGESTVAIARRRDPHAELFETMVMADHFFDEIDVCDGANQGGAS